MVKRLTVFLLKSGERQDIVLAISIQHWIINVASVNKTRNRNKNIQIGKDKITLFLFTDDILSMSKIQRDLQKMLLEQINEFIKTAGYKITIQKPILFWCTSNNQ